MKDVLYKLNLILTKKDKRFATYLLIFSVFISIIETVGVAVIMPFVAVASDFTLIESNEYYSYVYSFFDFNSAIDFVIVFGVALAFFYMARSAINLFYFYMLARFSHSRMYLITYRLFENYMGMSYREFVSQNTSVLTKTIISEAAVLSSLIESTLLIANEILVMTFIYSMMLYVNYEITLILTVILVLNVLFITKMISTKMRKQGVVREKYQRDIYEVINSTLGNFKFIKLRSKYRDILNKFAKATYGYSKVSIFSSVLGYFPRLFLEAIGFGLVTLSIVFIVWKSQSDIAMFLPTVTMFILALYRLMPSVNRIVNNYNSILYQSKSLDIIHDDLMYHPVRYGEKHILFESKIILNDVSFAYDENNLILKDVNLIINRGEKIAFVGKSGIGKSTIVDVIIGLYKPCSGNIMIDNDLLSDDNINSYRKKIGYIPQSVYLFDGTVAQNIAFEFEYDENKIKRVLSQANILEFLEEKQEGIFTKVGEGGIKLSGGQKQRIAIARALYNNPEILVLDEATSALDSETESKIMDEIYDVSQDKTLIIIAHRLSTLEKCEKIYEIENYKLKEI